MKRSQTTKRSISTIPQTIERLMKAAPQRRMTIARSNERILWGSAPHATFPSTRPSVTRIRRTGLMASALVTCSGRRSGFARVGTLVEMALMSIMLPAFVLAIPLMLSACAPKFVDIEQTMTLPTAYSNSINTWCCQVTRPSDTPVQ